MLTIVLRQRAETVEIGKEVTFEDKVYTQDFISGRAFRRAIEIQKELKDGFDEKKLDMLADYVVNVFGAKFTVDQFYDGIAADKLVPTLVGCIRQVTGQAAEALGSDGNSDPN